MKAGLDKRWTHSNHSTDFCVHCFYHQDQPINNKSWSLPRSGLKRTADGAVLAQSSLESQRSELEGEVETGLPFDFKRKSWSSEKIYDIFPRHPGKPSWNRNVQVSTWVLCKWMSFLSSKWWSQEWKTKQPHEKVREVFNLSNSSLQNHFPQVFFLGKPYKKKRWTWSKTALQVASRSPKRKTPCWRDTSALGGKKGCWDEIWNPGSVFVGMCFFSLEMKLSVFFFGGGLRYGKMWVFGILPRRSKWSFWNPRIVESCSWERTWVGTLEMRDSKKEVTWRMHLSQQNC